MDAVIDAPNKEVALAQINTMKGYSKKALNLPLSEIWTKYEVHPDRARPLTPHEPLMYCSTLQKFIDYAHGITGNPKNKRSALSSICLYSLPNLVSKNMVDLLPEELLCAFDHPNCYGISPEDLWLYYRKGMQSPEQ